MVAPKFNLTSICSQYTNCAYMEGVYQMCKDMLQNLIQTIWPVNIFLTAWFLIEIDQAMRHTCSGNNDLTIYNFCYNKVSNSVFHNF